MMMDDQDLEARLQGYRPAGPLSDLRARVVAAHVGGVTSRVPPVRNTLAWLPAAAAVLLATMFYWLAAAERQRLFAQLSPAGVQQSIDVGGEVRP